MSLWLRLRALLVCSLLLFGLAACAGTPDTSEEDFEDSGFGSVYAEEIDEPSDPLEVPNRFMFAFNEALDVMLIRPLAVTYKFWVPEGIRDSVRNFLRNLSTPIILANDLLQGNWERADNTLSRFIVNSSAGMLGLIDAAEGLGHPYHEEDFGQTLGSYGIADDVYLVLPLLGPSNLRDAGGKVVDYFIDPLTYLLSTEAGLARAGVTGLDFRQRNIETLDELKKDSLDFYARIRSLYSQRRQVLIENREFDDAKDEIQFGAITDGRIEAE